MQSVSKEEEREIKDLTNVKEHKFPKHSSLASEVEWNNESIWQPAIEMAAFLKSINSGNFY